MASSHPVYRMHDAAEIIGMAAPNRTIGRDINP
jgi:hypothetical protein